MILLPFKPFFRVRENTSICQVFPVGTFDLIFRRLVSTSEAVGDTCAMPSYSNEQTGLEYQSGLELIVVGEATICSFARRPDARPGI